MLQKQEIHSYNYSFYYNCDILQKKASYLQKQTHNHCIFNKNNKMNDFIF